MKADDKVEYEDVAKDNQPKFTHFEELKKRVELMQEVIDEHAEILRENDLIRTNKIEAPYFDEDKVFRMLEAEE